MKTIKKLWDKSCDSTYKFMMSGGWLTCTVVGLLWIIIALIGFIVTQPSGLCFILLFDIPFGIYLIWCIYQIIRMTKKNIQLTKEMEESKKCHHDNKGKVIYRDIRYDRENDNDDLEDFPTFIEVKYCKDCGKILSVDILATIEIDLDRVPFQYIPNESSYAELDEFKKVTGVTELPSLLDKEKYIK